MIRHFKIIEVRIINKITVKSYRLFQHLFVYQSFPLYLPFIDKRIIIFINIGS